MHKLRFFLFYGSVYTYLAAMRIEAMASASGAAIEWRPFNLRAILIEQNNTAFARNPVRMNYVWRDVERRAARHGIPFAGRPPYPVDPDLLALKVGVVAARGGWCAPYTRATFRAWFLEHQTPGAERHLPQILESLGKDPAQVIAEARSSGTEAALALHTEEARRLGIFGSPSFAIGDEIFWGDDRLEEAIDWPRGAP